MASVFRKTFTKPLPENAEIFTRKGERFARWKHSRGGKVRTASLTTGRDGSDRIVYEAGTYTAKYRDGQGIVREVPTGCRDKQSAMSVLKELTDRAEKVKAKIITLDENRIASHQQTPLSEHIGTYLIKLEVDDTSKKHRANVKRCLRRVADECRFGRLTDLNRDSFERWLATNAQQGMSARTRNLSFACTTACTKF